MIRTVHGFGYAFCGEATMTLAQAPVAAVPRPVCSLAWGELRFQLGLGEHIIGRDECADVRLDAATVSRRHARLIVGPHGVRLEDLGSKNGTFRAAVRLTAPTPIIRWRPRRHRLPRVDAARPAAVRHDRNGRLAGTPRHAFLIALASGSRIGRFEIVQWIGAGGMGEVYRARDTRLGRDVAIKLIAERFARDGDRVQRFEQEACAAGQLNHPNVLSVHDVGIHDGRPYLVCELLTGESLRARLSRGGLPPRRAIDYARQTAEGLAAAHARGIVHRDLKPDNLFVTSDDRVKILDFGVAKLTQPNDHPIAAGGDTEIGTVLGTIDYMSPEQVRGEPVDVRSDIFSLGIILHEMLTGHAPFAGATKADTMAAILKDDPAASLPGDLPVALERIVGRCLEKARDSRFQSARDLAFGLDVLSRTDLTAAIRPPRFRWMRARALPWVVVTVLAAALVAGVAAWSPWRSTRAPRPLRLSVDLGGDTPLGLLSAQFGNAVAISPDGSTIAFVGQRDSSAPPQLYVRRLDEARATVLPGTDGANAPFFSPDGTWLGFDIGLELKKIAVTGGAPILLAPLISMRGASWAPDGSVVFSPGLRPGTRLMLLPASGGAATPLTTLAEGEGLHTWPQVLPGGKAVLYTSSRVTGAFNDANIVVQPMPTGTPKIVQRGGYHAVYARSGHILYVHDGALFAMPFDIERLEPNGSAVRVLDGLGSNGITGGAQFSVSDTGTLVYQPGPSLGGGSPIDIVDRDGTAKRLRATPANWFTPALSADGRRLAISVRQGPSEAGDIWVHEAGKEQLTRVTSDPGVDLKPVWTPDGGRITFASDRGNPTRTQNLFWQPADGSGVAERLTTSANEQFPGSWHPSGRFLAFDELHEKTMRDVMILNMEGDEASGWKPGAATVFVRGPQMDWDPRFSPDGHWLAYASSESGRSEVYVRPFPGPGEAVKVSSAGGEFAAWSASKREIVYGLEGQVMIAAYAVHGARFTVETPRPWTGGRYQTRGRNRMFELHPDGDHLVLAVAAPPAGSGTTATAQFVFNFFEELRRVASVNLSARPR